MPAESPLTASLDAFLKSHPPEAVWLVACSGGQDSVALVELLRRLGRRFAVAHVNYHLRGADSEADEATVCSLAGSAQMPCHIFSSNILKKTGLQAEARKIRYAYFKEICDKYGYYGTLVAHHAQDQAETILHNLMRGTGLKGLAGMRAWNAERRIGRPLLLVPKEAITAFAQAEHLKWREDATNGTDIYLRNRIRHKLLPVLQELEPNWQANLLLTARQACEAWYDALAARQPPEDMVIELLPATYGLDLAENRFSRAGRMQAAYPGLAFPLALRLSDAAAHPGGTADDKLETALGLFEVKGENLHFAPSAGKAEGSRKTPASLPAAITITPNATAPDTVEEIRTHAAQGIYYLSAAACHPPYTLRAPQEGDRIQPLGMQGTRLISDIRGEMGLPPSAARDLRVLAREDGVILWLSTGGVSEAARCEVGALSVCIESK